MSVTIGSNQISDGTNTVNFPASTFLRIDSSGFTSSTGSVLLNNPSSLTLQSGEIKSASNVQMFPPSGLNGLVVSGSVAGYASVPAAPVISIGTASAPASAGSSWYVDWLVPSDGNLAIDYSQTLVDIQFNGSSISGSPFLDTPVVVNGNYRNGATFSTNVPAINIGNSNVRIKVKNAIGYSDWSNFFTIRNVAPTITRIVPTSLGGTSWQLDVTYTGALVRAAQVESWYIIPGSADDWRMIGSVLVNVPAAGITQLTPNSVRLIGQVGGGGYFREGFANAINGHGVKLYNWIGSSAWSDAPPWNQ